MKHDTAFLISAFYSVMGNLGIAIEHLSFAYTPVVKGESLIAAFYSGREIKDKKLQEYRGGVALFKQCPNGVCFLQKIPIHCSRDLKEAPALKGVLTIDGQWLLVDLSSVNTEKPIILGYFNPMAFTAPMGHRWHIAMPNHYPYNVSPFGGVVRMARDGRIVSIQ